jgi:hypothetical protein
LTGSLTLGREPTVYSFEMERNRYEIRWIASCDK